MDQAALPRFTEILNLLCPTDQFAAAAVSQAFSRNAPTRARETGASRPPASRSRSLRPSSTAPVIDARATHHERWVCTPSMSVSPAIAWDRNISTRAEP